MNLAKFIIRFRFAIITLTIIFTLISVYFSTQLTINSDFSSYLPESDEAVRALNYISHQYSGKHIAIVAVKSKDIFLRETIEKIQFLTSQFKRIDGVSYVTSLTNIIDIRKSNDFIEISKLIDERTFPITDEKCKELKEYVLSKMLYRGRIVSDDASVALIVCRLREGSDEIRIAKEIKNIIENNFKNDSIYCAGYSFNLFEVNTIIADDLRTLLFISLLIIVLVLYASYKTIRGVLLPLLSVSISILWTLGFMSILKLQISLVTNVIPIILIAVGSAYSIHVLSKFEELSESNDDRVLQVHKVLNEVTKPIFLAAITTMVGFISFVFGSYLSVIKEFGILSAVGIFFAFVTSLTVIPSIISLLPMKCSYSSTSTTKNSSLLMYFENIVLDFVEFISRNKSTLIKVSIVISVLCIYFLSTIERSVDMTKYFKEGTDIRIASELMRNKFNGDLPIYCIVRGDILNPRVLHEIKKLQEFIKSQRTVSNPYSVVDLIEEMNDVMGEGRTIPDSKDKVENLWFLLEGDELVRQMVNSSKTEALIQATMPSIDDPHEIDLLSKNIHSFITTNIDSSIVTITITGMPFINLHMDKAIVQSQIQSLGIALLFVFTCMIVLQRSFKGGLISVIPIVLTLLIIFGCMGFFNIPLNLATVLVGSISLGIGIDYPIHFINRYRREYLQTHNPLSSLAITLTTTGKAILINILTVTTGFLVLVFSNLVPLQNLGILIGITMVSSGLSTLTLLPAIFVAMKTYIFLRPFQNKKTNKDLIM
ncbi:MAG: MMPL family transporter [Bacteroidetes bacterium]|nr:MMPL family transporter [Bacteroidota bacterium]